MSPTARRRPNPLASSRYDDVWYIEYTFDKEDPRETFVIEVDASIEPAFIAITPRRTSVRVFAELYGDVLRGLIDRDTDARGSVMVMSVRPYVAVPSHFVPAALFWQFEELIEEMVADEAEDEIAPPLRTPTTHFRGASERELGTHERPHDLVV